MKRLIVSLLIAMIVPALFWTVGFDFDHRGQEAAGCFAFTMVMFFGAYSFPYWYL